MSDLTEPGRHVAADARLVYHWPPEARYAALWQRIEAALPNYDDKDDAAALLCRWLAESSTDLAYTDEEGELVDVEPNWAVPMVWLDPGPPRATR